jgi:hypothetical protein
LSLRATKGSGAISIWKYEITSSLPAYPAYRPRSRPRAGQAGAGRHSSQWHFTQCVDAKFTDLVQRESEKEGEREEAAKAAGQSVEEAKRNSFQQLKKELEKKKK